MNAEIPADDMPRAVMERLLARHGLARVMLALVAARLHQRRMARMTRVEAWPDHMRRDIGLTPLPPDPRDWQRFR